MPALAQADGRWTLSLGGGYADQFTYQTTPGGALEVGSVEYFDFSWLALAGVGYRLANRITLQADAGYIGYGNESTISFARPTSGFPGPWPNVALTARMPFVSAGVRFFATGPASPRPRFYMEASPALWMTRWEERYESGQYTDLDGNFHPNRVTRDAFTTLEPGFTAGAGLLGPLVGRTNLDMGFRYLFSMGPGRRNLGQYSSGDFKGLRQLALVMSVHRAF